MATDQNPFLSIAFPKKKQFTYQPNAQGNNIFGTLDPNTQQQVNTNLQGMLTGKLFEPSRLSANEALATAAQNYRAQAGVANAGAIGQGTAVTNQQGVERDIFGQVAQTQLGFSQQEADMKRLGVDAALNIGKANEGIRQFDENMRQGAAALNEQARSNDIQAYLAERGMSSQEKIAGMQIASAEKIAQDRNWLEQQNIDISKAQVYGYTDANGNHVKGSLEMAAEELGLKTRATENEEQRLQLMRDELFGYTDEGGMYHKGKYDFMDEDQQLRAKELFGYENANGDHVMGRLELAADANLIQRQGLSLQQAELYGYRKADGTQVKGTLDLKAEELGIMKNKYDDDFDIENRRLKIAEDTAEATEYWDGAQRFISYASTHDVDNILMDKGAMRELSLWFEAKFGYTPNVTSSEFREWAKTEWQAANDKKLTNPFDATLHAINSSDALNDQEKQMLAAFFKDPKMLAAIYGITVDNDGNISLDTAPNVTVRPGALRGERDYGLPSAPQNDTNSNPVTPVRRDRARNGF